MMPNAAPFSLTQPFGVRSQRALLVGLIFVVVLLLALITLPPLASARADALRTHLDTNVQVFANTLTAVENNVQEMQAATRGYILTQQPAFLEQYRAAQDGLPARLQDLGQLAPRVDESVEAPIAEFGSEHSLLTHSKDARELGLRISLPLSKLCDALAEFAVIRPPTCVHG